MEGWIEMTAIKNDALYGGTVLATNGGFVEVSIFEAGIPPQFRLYFYDRLNRPIAPRPGQCVWLETIRPDSEGQVFEFVEEGSFLKSTSDIPEPHEFTVNVHLSPDGKNENY